ncbi:hypothetical protein NDU88_006501 [Pleurodeles waltl]|uniref:Uncharacterized protein n=1 Tax=Pleurodeles waltl TaxID=8319 RepID=A0AAV7SPZ4_PLEWA|nr:hypothetical protein NDU88_006501 [Pleurodeles waltl]
MAASESYGRSPPPTWGERGPLGIGDAGAEPRTSSAQAGLGASARASRETRGRKFDAWRASVDGAALDRFGPPRTGGGA